MKKSLLGVLKANYKLLVGISMAAATVASTAAAVLTPGSNVTATILARASFTSPTDIKFKIEDGSQEVLHVSDARETVVQRVVIGPGGHTGWHSHPGPGVVLVTSGNLSFYSGEDPACQAETYSAGESFIDSGQGHVHIARNESTTDNLELWVTYFDVPPTAPVRIDAPAPGNCPF